MARSLSEQMLGRKREKVGAQVRSHVAEWWTHKPFDMFANKPTPDQAEAMFMAGRFGPGEPLTEGGDLFAFEYMLDELSIAIETFNEKRLAGEMRIIDPEAHAIRIVTAQSEDWANMMFVSDIDERLVDYWTRLGTEDFRFVYQGDVLVYAVERESQAFGVRIAASPLVPITEAYAIYGEPVKFVPRYRPSPWKANDKCTIYFLTVGPLDRLLTPDERIKHGVQGFTRRLSMGRSIAVRPHERRNPRRLGPRAGNLDEVGHVVYRAYDAGGTIRYFGEGLTGRPAHVNSGVSHNFKLNEHFFRVGPMRVEVFARGLSKDEALAVERLCIRGNKGSALWNIKDYEPLVDGPLLPPG